MRVSLTFRIERVKYIRFKLKNFMIAQTECAEAKRHPAQTFACRMRPGRMRVGGADNFTEQHERRVREIVFLEDGIERNIFAVMPEFATVNVKGRRASFLCLCLNL